MKIFEIGSVIEIKCYLTFRSLPKAPGGRSQKHIFAAAHPIYVSNSYIKFGWNLPNVLGGDNRQTDSGRQLQYPLIAVLKHVGIISIKEDSRLCKLLRLSSFLISPFLLFLNVVGILHFWKIPFLKVFKSKD